MLKKIGTKFQTLIYNRFFFMSQKRLKFWNKKVLLSCLVALYMQFLFTSTGLCFLTTFNHRNSINVIYHQPFCYFSTFNHHSIFLIDIHVLLYSLILTWEFHSSSSEVGILYTCRISHISHDLLFLFQELDSEEDSWEA